MERYAAKLLFQWRLMRNGRDLARSLCEERTIVLEAKSMMAAIVQVRKKGRGAAYRTRNMHGDPVSFEFVGIVDMIHLGIDCEPDEVWYDIRILHRPMERQRQLTKSNRELLRPTRWPSWRPNQILDLLPGSVEDCPE